MYKVYIYTNLETMRYFSFLLLIFLLASCKSESTKSGSDNAAQNLPAIDNVADLQALGQSVYDTTTGRINNALASQFISQTEIFVNKNKAIEDAPVLLHRAAETARSIRQIPKALGLYERIITEYPNHEKAAQALFLKAFTYDDDLNEFEKAKEMYDAFLAKYPTHDFADDTEFLLKNLGKTDEEILQSLDKGGN